MLNSLSPMAAYPTREEAGIHLDFCFTVNRSCYDEQHANSDWSRDAGWLITECLGFRHEAMYSYGVGKAPRAVANGRAKQHLRFCAYGQLGFYAHGGGCVDELSQ